MGTIASQESPESGTPSDEGGVRAAIIDAARKVARREGMLEMTLTGVANEAGVSAMDIYTFFTSKNDLLQAVVADDLASVAKTMRRSIEQPLQAANTAPPDADAVPLPLAATGTDGAAGRRPVVETFQPRDTQVPPMQPAESFHTDEQSAPQTGDPAPAQDSPKRFPTVQPRRDSSRLAAVGANTANAEAIAHLQEAVAKLEARPVDQWLERRLREFERTLYGLQHNQNQRASGPGLEHGLQSLQESIEALDMRHTIVAEEAARATGERFDQLEKDVRQTLSDLRDESVHLARRITALENLAFAPRPEPLPPPVAFAPVEEQVSAPEPLHAAVETTHDPADHASEVATDHNEAVPSFLATARRSAQDAAARVSEDVRQKPVAPKQNKTLFYAACGSFALFIVVLAGFGWMLRDSSVRTATAGAAARPAPVHIARAAVARPVQRVVQAQSQTSLAKLAEAGDASAELLLGLQYLEGKGEPKNEALAVDWLSRAAAKGQPVAQYDLGALYADGRGVPANSVQAFQWFGSAALHGNRRAMHFLAIAYAEGVGTTKDLSAAAHWFERSATLGAVNSQFNLAVLYERGMGVPQSLTEAYKWYAIAAGQGDREAEARVAALTSTLNPDDLASAKAAADAFKPQPLDPAANLPPRLPS